MVQWSGSRSNRARTVRRSRNGWLLERYLLNRGGRVNPKRGAASLSTIRGNRRQAAKIGRGLERRHAWHRGTTIWCVGQPVADRCGNFSGHAFPHTVRHGSRHIPPDPTAKQPQHHTGEQNVRSHGTYLLPRRLMAGPIRVVADSRRHELHRQVVASSNAEFPRSWDRPADRAEVLAVRFQFNCVIGPRAPTATEISGRTGKSVQICAIVTVYQGVASRLLAGP